VKAFRDELFENYARTHGDFADHDGESSTYRLEFFHQLVERNYASLLASNEVRILEIGCGKGYFLAVLKDCGYTNLTGIDLDPQNIAACKERFQLSNVFAADAEKFLKRRPTSFDVIFLKDVLEHIPKAAISTFIQSIVRGLSRNGMLIIQVPNMDWSFASHERYMDLTHEVGFTRESLGQLLRLHFESVEIRKVDGLFRQSWKHQFVYNVFRPWYVRVVKLRRILMGEGAHDFWFDCREISAVCKTPVRRPLR
jgi:2-polyprenyl-3-methyl-5-hydroxy-6-metoxy-1,4-benzoquinol methylase